MNAEEIVTAIGWSHLLQPPLSLLMARPRALDLMGAFASLDGVAACIARVMGAASILLPTAQGVLLATCAGALRTNAVVAALALLVAGFWSCRLVAQLWMWHRWPAQRRGYYWLLVVVFVVQGPLLGSVASVAGWSALRG